MLTKKRWFHSRSISQFRVIKILRLFQNSSRQRRDQILLEVPSPDLFIPTSLHLTPTRLLATSSSLVFTLDNQGWSTSPKSNCKKLMPIPTTPYHLTLSSDGRTFALWHHSTLLSEFSFPKSSNIDGGDPITDLTLSRLTPSEESGDFTLEALCIANHEVRQLSI